MTPIEVNQITLADASSSVPSIPNVVPSSAESLNLSIDATNLPANTRKVRITATIFLPNGRPRIRGWFNSRVVDVGPVYKDFEVLDGRSRTFELEIVHPDHVKQHVRWAAFRKLIGRLLLFTPLAILIRLLFSIRWHNGPGPYDTEVNLTAADASGTTIPGSSATFQYPFVSI
jgi:hypothetical protein